MDVEKMRRQSQRITEAAERENRAAWLASLTPEHRAVHQHPLGALCSECLHAGARRLGEDMARVLMAARGRSRVGLGDSNDQ